MNYDERYMHRAIQLARNGQIFASPNPMVGAVIVYNDTIIGEGFHHRCGEAHAEVNAVASVSHPELLPHATIYVTLEPCSHYGKTPPCAQLIIDKKIPRVVIGCLDPFEKVSGRGVKMLQDAGIEVIWGVLENECKELNSKFITCHTKQRPFITLKWAQSSDGFIDHHRTHQTPNAIKISTPITSCLVHKLRATHDAIMVGSSTVIKDNPSLNCRSWNGNNPKRIVIDRQAKLHNTANIFNDKLSPTIYFTSKIRKELPCDVEQILVDTNSSLCEIMRILYNKGITSVLLEGGASLLQNAIDNNIWDEAQVEISPITLCKKGSINAPILNIMPYKSLEIDNHYFAFYHNK